MATYNLGRILPRFRGQWDPTINYDKLDVVYFEGSSYMALSDNINKRPDENESDWVLSAAKGEPGEPGKDGPTYKAGKGISIINDVISATGSGGEGGETYFNGFGIEIDEDTNNINAEVKADNDVPDKWESVTFSGMSEEVADDFESKNVFHYKGKTYYSAGLNKNYVLDGLSWEKVEWIGVEIYGEDIFVDAKGDMYYFHGNQYMKYDEDLDVWPPVSINVTNAYGRYMFVGKNGYSYYSENSNKTYKIKAGNITTWEKVSVNQNCPATFIWEDETTTYYSNGINHFYYDYTNDRWRTQKWTGVNTLYGNQIWKQGSYIFYTPISGATYIKKGSKWENIYTIGTLDGKYIFNDGENVYSYISGHGKKLVIPEPFYVTRHGDKLATEEFVLEHAGKINEGFGITAKKNDDGSVTVSTVVTKSMKPSADYFTKIETIMKGDSALSYSDVQDIWTDNEMNTYLYDETHWYKWDGTNFSQIDKTANISYGRNVWKHQGRIFHTAAGSSQEYINGSWQEISFNIDNDMRTFFDGKFICSVGDIAYAYTMNNSQQYNYISRLLPNSTRWISELSVRQLSVVHPWVDNSGVFYFGNYKIVNDKIVDSTLTHFNNGLHVWFNKHSQIYYRGLRYATSDCENEYDAVWSGEYDILGTVFEVDGRYICVGDSNCYELKEMKVVDEQNQTLITEHDLDIKLGFIDNILKRI